MSEVCVDELIVVFKLRSVSGVGPDTTDWRFLSVAINEVSFLKFP